MNMTRCLLCLAIASLLRLTISAEDWPHWRGPQRNGHSAEKGWRAEWPAEGPKILWKATVGLGFSGLVTGDGRLFSVGYADNQDTIFSFDAVTGRELWRHAYPSQLGDKYYEGGTTGSPTLDAGRLYWLSRWGDLFCLEAATGKVVWEKNIQKETGIRIPEWGFTGAPYVHGQWLILNIGEAGLAVEKASGKLAWKSADQNAGYSTPVPFQQNGENLLVIGSNQHYIAFVPETGREVWRVRWVTEYGVNAADPIIAQGKMLLSTGYGKGAALFDLSRNPPAEIWKNKALRTQLNAAVLHEGFVYGVDGDTSQKASLKCLDFQTGEQKWSEAGFGSGGLIIADGKLIALSAQGELMVAPASPDGFNPSARAQVLGGKSWTAPILAHGRIYCRNSRGEIVCVDVTPAAKRVAQAD